MIKHTGMGWVSHEKKGDRGFLYLQNFDIDSPLLKPQHTDALRKAIVPAVNQGGSLTIVGTTDRLGSSNYNEQLSIRRIESVLDLLFRECEREVKADRLLAKGETQAAAMGMRDNSRGDAFRAVTVVVWPRPVPRPIQAQEIKVPAAPGVFFFTNWGFSFDIGVGVIDALALATEAVLLEVASGALAVIGPILAGTVAYAEADRAAEFNGVCEGFWLGMQAMSDQYSGPALDKTPYDQWPALKVPVIPKPRDYLPNRWGMLADKGRQHGAKLAYEAIKNMEAKPVTVKVSVKGKQEQLPVRGRLWLRAVRKKYGGNAGEWVKGEVNKKLMTQGLGKWPVGASNRIGGARQ